ncbi:MAG: hypothetical protein IJA36_07895 [Lachnospiraceae bacterium]|nr:hypothetical protein [Lachnospiraceae bacterium]
MFEIGVVTDAIEKFWYSFGELAGEFKFFGERFESGYSGVVGKCGKLDGNCGRNSFSARLVWNFSVSLAEQKTMFHLKIRTLPCNLFIGSSLISIFLPLSHKFLL